MSIKEFDEYVGIMTEADLTRKVLGKGLNAETTQISEVMTSPILSLDCYLPIEEANRFMYKNKIRHLAVTEEDNSGHYFGERSGRLFFQRFSNARVVY